MGILDLFACKPKPNAGEMELTVLYVTARDGLSPEDAFAIRKLILSAQPIDFGFLNPGSFELFFQGSEAGKLQANDLASQLKAFAITHSISSFGVGIKTGRCIVEQNAKGQFTSRPLGETITQAMHAAIAEAKNAL